MKNLLNSSSNKFCKDIVRRIALGDRSEMLNGGWILFLRNKGKESRVCSVAYLVPGLCLNQHF